ILLAVAAAVYWYVEQLGYVSTDDAFIDSDKLTVSAKMLGRIINLTVDEGDAVGSGQLLVQLDSTDLKAQENQAGAMLDLARESINLAKVKLAGAREDYNRAKQQFKDKVIPREQYDHAQKALEAAKAEMNIDKIKIKTAEAQLNVIRTQLLNTSVFATMDGVIGRRWVLKGDVVQPGQPIYTMFNLDNVWVTANLEETKLSGIHNGDKTEISVDAYPDQKFSGEVFNVGANTASEFALIPPSNASGNFTKVTQRVPVKISIRPVDANGKPDPADNIRLLPGMSVEIKVRQDSNDE
ncbi:MAG: HlyD family secretion protein, partial [Calditrichaceae bacterium]